MDKKVNKDIRHRLVKQRKIPRAKHARRDFYFRQKNIRDISPAWEDYRQKNIRDISPAWGIYIDKRT